MGGSESGHLAVQVERALVQAGQEVTGVVYFHVQQPVHAETLCLKLSAKESCFWTSGSGDDSTSYRGKSSVLKQVFPIFVFQGAQVNPGDYTFPFRILTPPTLPSSLDFVKRDAQGRLRYTLGAFVSGTDAKVVKSKIEIRMSKQMTDVIVGVEDTVKAQLTSCCCLGQGEVQLRVQVQKNAYVPGETVQIEAVVDNSRSRAAVRGVRAEIHRIVRLRADSLLGTATSLYRDKLSEIFVNKRISAGTADAAAQMLSLVVGERTGAPQNTTTFAGRNIECRYEVTVEAVLDGMCMCCGQTPLVRRELLVYPMQVIPPLPQLQAPLGWNPQVMPEALFSLH